VIALSLAASFPEAEVDAVDISGDALALAGENAERLGLSERVKFLRVDLLTAVTHVYDIIVANLPYVAGAERGSVSREVLHDPAVAVFAGSTGGELIRKLIETASARLTAGGLLALEIGLGQAEALLRFLAERNYHDISARQDYAGVTRFLFARHG